MSLFQWSPLCCWHQEIDINSGRIRTTHFLFYHQIREKIEDSLLTKTLGNSLEENEPEWHRVNTFSPGVHYSPHYRYHSAIAQIGILEFIFSFHNLSGEAKKNMAKTILEKWQVNKNDFGADQYLLDVSRMIDKKEKSELGMVISVADLDTLETKR